MFGETVHPSAPKKKTIASRVMLWRRPYLSESLPPTEAPSAAPTHRKVPTRPSSQVLSARPPALVGRYM